MNLLTINFSKTKDMIFTPYSNKLPRLGLLSIDRSEIFREDRVKYLGIIVDQYTRWDMHVDKIVNNLRRLPFRFRYLRDFLTVDELKILYHSLVKSQTNYGILGWGGAYDTHLSGLRIVQR